MDSCDGKSNDSFVVKALAHLNIGAQSRGVINRLPNEMFRAILDRVPAHDLIHLRSVSNRWKDAIESVCRDKKRLVILRDWKTEYCAELCARLNGHLKLKIKLNFVFIRLRYVERFSHCAITLTGDICSLLITLFPQIEQFYIVGQFLYSTADFNAMLQQWSPSLSTLSLRVNPGISLDDFCAQINQLTSLKRLDLHTFPAGKAQQLAPTLARLEHLSGEDFPPITEIVPHLGDEFSSLGLYSTSTTTMTIEELTRWFALYPQSVSSIARFSLSINFPNDLSFVCEHFASLRMLCIYGLYCQLDTEMLENLARLRHLEEIRFDRIRIDVDFDDPIALYKIRTVSLVDFVFCKRGRFSLYLLESLPPNFDGHGFAQVLAAIFPYVSKLKLQSEKYPQLGNMLQPHVNLFVNLRSHDLNEPTL